MPVTRDMLLSELKELQRLTAFEQAVATVRRSQAASDAVAQELAANAGRSGERLALLAQAVRGVGGTPDLVGPVLGKLGALVQTQVNQVQTLQGALLGDLALEHQLRERARYARTLAVTLGEMSVLPVLDRLDGAHTETIGWLERRLGEVARTGSSALKATPIQVAVGSVRRVAAAPFGYAVDGVNQLGALVGKLTGRAPAVAGQVRDAAGTVADKAAPLVEKAAPLVDRAVAKAAPPVEDALEKAAPLVAKTAPAVAHAVEAAGEKVGAAAAHAADEVSGAADSASAAKSDAVSRASDAVAGASGSTAEAVSASTDDAGTGAGRAAPEDPAAVAEEITKEVLGASGGADVADAKAPFAGYERLPGDSIMRHVNDTEDVEELRVLLAFEQAHKARKGVLKAAQDRLTSIVG